MLPVTKSAFVFVLQPPRTSSRRDLELRDAQIKAHAAKVSHSRSKRKRAAKRPNTIALSGTIPTQANNGDLYRPHRPRCSTCKKDVRDRATEAERRFKASYVNARSPSPISMLDQSGRDPFNFEPSRNLPTVMLDLMNYAYEVLFPKNMPGIEKSAVRMIMDSRRKLATQHLAEFHCQVSNVATMAFAIVQDKGIIEVITRLRLVHQNMAIRLICEELRELRGPPSELLIQRVLLLAVQGGDPLEGWELSIHPESPIVRGSNIKGYYRFRIIPQYHAWVYLTKMRGGLDKITLPGLARRLQLADLSTAMREGCHPAFRLLASLEDGFARAKYVFDQEATGFQSFLGRSFRHLHFGIDDVNLSSLLNQACTLTVALDQYHRGGVGHSSLYDLSMAAVVLQHNLYSQPMLSELRDASIGFHDYLYEACRLFLMIYMDMVLWPVPWAVGIKQRLSRHLRPVLQSILDCLIHRDDSHEYTDLVLYMLLMGGIASTYTRDRSWYVRSFYLHLRTIANYGKWADFTALMSTFLWWDYVFDEPAFKLWTEAMSLRLSSTALPLLGVRRADVEPNPAIHAFGGPFAGSTAGDKEAGTAGTPLPPDIESTLMDNTTAEGEQGFRAFLQLVCSPRM